MGYTTQFEGSMKLDKKLTLKQAKFFLDMHFFENITEDEMVEKYQISEKLKRSYLQWVPGIDLECFVWDGNEKFYEYEEWLEFVIDRLKELDIGVSGQFTWSGEEVGDTGLITVNKDWSITIQSHYKNSSKNVPPLTEGDLAKMAIDSIGES